MFINTRMCTVIGSLYLWPFSLFLCYPQTIPITVALENIILRLGRIYFPICPPPQLYHNFLNTILIFACDFGNDFQTFSPKNYICALFVIHAFPVWGRRVFITWGTHTPGQWTTFWLFCEQRGRLKLSSYKVQICYVTTPWVFDQSKNHTWVGCFLLGSLLCKGKLMVLPY